MVSRIKVFVLIKGLGLGGAEKLLTLSLPYLDRGRFDYEVGYLLPWKNALVPQFEQAGIPVFCLNQRRDYDPRIIPRLARLLRHRRVELVHLHLPYAGIVGRIAGRLAHADAIVYTEHSLLEHHHRLTLWANRLTYPWNDATICVSEAVRRSVLAHLKVSENTAMSTIYNGIEPLRINCETDDAAEVRRQFGIPVEHQLVVHVANFNPQKRHQDLLQAARIILQSDQAITFLLVGHGRLETSMKAQAKSLGIEANVVFAGFQPEATRLMAAADLFVLPSRYEGLPVSLLEAMAAGTPVVASRVGGIPEAVTDGVEGFLVDPLSPSQLAQKVLEVLYSPELRRRFARNGMARVQKQFHVRHMVESTEALYDRVLAEKARS